LGGTAGDQTLPTFASAVDLVCRCDAGKVQIEGEPVGSWLEYCEASGVFHFPTVDYVECLAEAVERSGAQVAVEVAAGRGALAAALRRLGVAVTATDPRGEGPDVVECSAHGALSRFEPDLVIGCWTPVDSGIDAAVMAWPSVRRYLYIGHEHNGMVGHERLWQTPGWTHRRLEDADRVNLGRTDYCLDWPIRNVAQHGWTVVFERAS